MSDLIYPDEGRADAVSQILTGGVYLLLHNKPTPVTLGDVLADVTPYELTNMGYSRIHVQKTSFTFGQTGHLVYAIGPLFSWVNDDVADVTVTGYCVLNAAQTLLLTSFYFATPVTWHPLGSVQVTPTYTLESRFTE